MTSLLLALLVCVGANVLPNQEPLVALSVRESDSTTASTYADCFYFMQLSAGEKVDEEYVLYSDDFANTFHFVCGSKKGCSSALYMIPTVTGGSISVPSALWDLADVRFFHPDSTEVSIEWGSTLLTENAECPAKCESSTRYRQSYKDLDIEDWNIFTSSVADLAHLQTTWPLLDIMHREKDYNAYAHGTVAFGVWHRAFLYLAETLLRQSASIYSCVSIPYWDFTEDAGDIWNVELFSGNYSARAVGTYDKGCIPSGPFVDFTIPEGACVERKSTKDYTFDDTVVIFSYIEDNADVEDFLYELEESHGTIHVWVGGDMKKADSASDPLFYMLHANVDRFYALWQNCHGYSEESFYDISPENYGAADIDTAMNGFQWTPRQAVNLEFFETLYVRSVYFDSNFPTLECDGAVTWLVTPEEAEVSLLLELESDARLLESSSSYSSDAHVFTLPGQANLTDFASAEVTQILEAYEEGGLSSAISTVCYNYNGGEEDTEMRYYQTLAFVYMLGLEQIYPHGFQSGCSKMDLTNSSTSTTTFIP